jgi:hypothetical protein
MGRKGAVVELLEAEEVARRRRDNEKAHERAQKRQAMLKNHAPKIKF